MLPIAVAQVQVADVATNTVTNSILHLLTTTIYKLFMLNYFRGNGGTMKIFEHEIINIAPVATRKVKLQYIISPVCVATS